MPDQQRGTTVTKIYAYGDEGCFFDYSAGHADQLNRTIVRFAVEHGFEIEAAEDIEGEGVDTEDAYTYLADEAVTYLNDNCVGIRMSFEIEDSSLFLRCDEPTKEDYDEWLDEAYGDVAIAGLTYSTSDALKSCDPIAYRVGFSDYVSYCFDE